MGTDNIRDICRSCIHYKKDKCEKHTCRKCYEAMIKSRLRKYPIGKF